MRRHARYIPWAVLGVMLAVTYQAWRIAEHGAMRVREAEFEFRTRDVADRVRQRMQDYELALAGARALFAGQHAAGHREFADYVSALRMRQQFPGILGISFAPFVPRAGKTVHERDLRLEGVADYVIRPEGERDSYAPVSYIAPLTERNRMVLGFDNLASPVRRAALERARDLDRAVVSEKLELVQDGSPSARAGVLMFLPVYQSGARIDTPAARKAHIAGWLAAAFHMSELMAGVLGPETGGLDVELYDGTEPEGQRLMFDAHDASPYAETHLFKSSSLIEIGGRPWLLTFHSLPQFEAGVDRSKAYLIAGAGMLVSVLLFLLSTLLVRDRSRALLIAEGASDELREQRKFQQLLLEREATLREAADGYSSMFDSPQDFVFTMDSAHRFTSMTGYFSKQVGYTQEEVIGIHVSKFLSPESFEKAMQNLSEKLRGESSVSRYEVEAIAKDGRVIPVELSTSLIHSEGRIVGVQGIGRDITERRRYEQALRESEEKYRGLFENAGDFAYSTDLEGNFTATSDMLFAATGFARGELTSIGQLLSPEQRMVARNMTAAKLAGKEQATRYELELSAADGRKIPVEVVSTLIYREGKPVGVQGIARDIAERKRAEEALRRSESNYRELMEQATEPIFIYDHQLRCVDVNRAAQDVFGFSREEFLKSAMRDLVHPEDRARLEQPDEREKLQLMREGKLTIHGNRRLRCKDGRYIPVQISAKRLPDGRILSIKRDISEWLAREAALRHANAQAEAANRAKSDFLANMSHEIRTPMNSVIGMARLALSRETDARQIDYLDKILMSGEHLLGIIDDILDFSKIDAGKLRIEQAELDVVRIVEGLSALLSDQARQKGLRFSTDIDPAMPRHLRGDPLRLRQVMLNFMGNAIKFTTRGEIAVNVRVTDATPTGCRVHFEVCDTGIGISEGELSGLFQSFHQADNSVTRQYGGTGLGLVISKRLVELMGGEIGVESELGKGSTFWFRVWLPQGTGAMIAATGTHLPAWLPEYDALRGKHVLLVENNLFNQQVAREFLENAGIVVVVANNGAEALDLLRHERFDGVLMDLHMPVMDGLEATRQIRANPDLAAMPVIAMTANVLEEERSHCLDNGMNDFITKPVHPEALYSVLFRWFFLEGAPAPAAEQTILAFEAVPRANAAAIDLSSLRDMIGNKPERLREFAFKFLATARADMERISDALAREDYAALRELGHHIKSPAAMMGALVFAGLGRALEDAPSALERNREIVRALQAELDRIEVQIKARFSDEATSQG